MKQFIMIQIIFPNVQDLLGSLVAITPHALDEDISRALVLIIGKNKSGGYNGIRINNPLLKKKEIIFKNIKLLDGGPVSKTTITFIHSPEVEWDHTIKLNNIFSSTVFNRKMENSFIQKPLKMIAAYGIYRWGVNQLENEIASGLWFNIPSLNNNKFLCEVIYDATIANRWYLALEQANLDVGAICIDNGRA